MNPHFTPDGKLTDAGRDACEQVRRQNSISWFNTKNEALEAVKVKGYNIHYHTGQSGDYGYGSREYFRAEDAPLNEYNMPISKHATVSKVAARWAVSEFK